MWRRQFTVLRVFVAACVFLVADVRSRVAITEVMRDPPGLESAAPGGRSHEYVELLNLGPDTLTLDSLFVSDGADADSIRAWSGPRGVHSRCIQGSRALAPGRVAIVLDPDYDSAVLRDPSCALAIADSTVLWVCGDAHLGDYSNLSATDGLMLYRGSMSAIASVLCAAVDTGTQLPPEPNAHLALSNVVAPEGWSVCAGSLLFGEPSYQVCPGGTSPGVVECMRGGWMVDARFGGMTGGALPCTLAVLKPGVSLAQSSIEQAGSSVVLTPVTGAWAQVLAFAGAVKVNGGPANGCAWSGVDTVRWDLDWSSQWVAPGTIIVNEVFPRSGNDGPEWFELYNRSSGAVSLDGWRYGDGADDAPLAPSGVVMQGRSFLVVAQDRMQVLARYPTATGVVQAPQWLTMSNERDSLVLTDNRGNRHETVFYDAEWFSDWDRGSLERIWPDRPAVTAGAWADAWPMSPGLPNPAILYHSALRPSMTIGPVPFSPNGDGRDDRLRVRIAAPAGHSCAVEVLGMDGRMVRRLEVAAGEAWWDGRRDDGRWGAPGPFFVVARFTKAGAVTVIRARGILWR